jgi:hypothetical protein
MITPDQVVTEEYAAYMGDCVELVRQIPDDSVGLSVFSPPFPGMYAYTDSPRDMGNCEDIDQMIGHFGFLVPGLLRALMPGRNVACHITQSPAFKWCDGYVGLKDFRGKTISLFESHGFIYYGEVVIDKCPQLKAARTNDSTLQMKTFCSDASKLRPALADILLIFKKPGDNTVPVPAGTHAAHPDAHGWLTPDQWIKWARPVWGDIKESKVLQTRAAKDDGDEKHLCPLQLEVIERSVLLWTNPGEIVLSPFMGIGSEGYESIRLGRKFVGFELKPSYFRVACENLASAVEKRQYGSLI